MTAEATEGAIVGATIDASVGASTGTLSPTSAQHRTLFATKDEAQVVLRPAKLAPKASINPPSQASIVHSSVRSSPQPVLRASFAWSSNAVHIRAPALSQKSRASGQVKSPLHPERFKSLSPHTSELPKVAEFVQPRSSQLDADLLTAGRGVGAGVVSQPPPSSLAAFSGHHAAAPQPVQRTSLAPQ